MAERSRRARRQVSDVTEDSSNASDSESGDDWADQRSAPPRKMAKHESATSATSSSRPKRISASASTNGTSSATIQRSISGSPDDRRQSIKLTVKVPPSKLREVMRASEVDALQDTLGGGRVLDGPRSRRSLQSRASGRQAEKPRYAEYGESDLEDEDAEAEDDEEDEEEDEDEDEDEEGEDDDDEPNDFEEIGAEAEGGTDEEEEDVEMDDAAMAKPRTPPKPPRITLKPPTKQDGKGNPKPRLIVTPAPVGPLISVEDQEMEDHPGDSEVADSSELSDDEANEANDEDAEGEDEMEGDDDGEGLGEGDDDELDDDEDLDSSDETPASGMATPDPNRMTKRQRGQPQDEGGLMALDMAPQQRKFFTDAEKAMKKDEHARKRKELTKRKVQEEKAAALNRLLKPQASKARGAAPKPETLAAATAAAGSSMSEDEYVEKPHPLYTRWVSTKDGVKLGVPEEWLGKRVGKLFEPASNGMVVQEVD